MPRKRNGVSARVSPNWLGMSSGTDSTAAAGSPLSPWCRIDAKPRVVGASGGAEKNSETFCSPAGSTSMVRNSGDLALDDLFEQVRVVGKVLRQRGELVGEFQQEFQALAFGDGLEVVDDFGKFLGKVAHGTMLQFLRGRHRVPSP